MSCLASPGDVRLLPAMVKAAENATPMSADEQRALIDARAADPIIFDGPHPISK